MSDTLDAFACGAAAVLLFGIVFDGAVAYVGGFCEARAADKALRARLDDIDMLNDACGGDWYYDEDDGLYHDSSTTRTAMVGGDDDA